MTSLIPSGLSAATAAAALDTGTCELYCCVLSDCSVVQSFTSYVRIRSHIGSYFEPFSDPDRKSSRRSSGGLDLHHRTHRTTVAVPSSLKRLVHACNGSSATTSVEYARSRCLCFFIAALCLVADFHLRCDKGSSPGPASPLTPYSPSSSAVAPAIVKEGPNALVIRLILQTAAAYIPSGCVLVHRS